MRFYDGVVDDTQRQAVEPHSIISGSLPGATEIRIGNNIKISGKKQQVLVNAANGNVAFGATDDGRLAMEVTNKDGTKTGIGQIPGSTDLGFYTLDSSGNVIQKIVGPTRFVYDISTSKNVMQDGKLPDATYGFAVAATNKNVTEGYQ